MKTVNVSTKGRIVIPVRIRRQYGIKPGTRVYFTEHDNKIILEPITPQFYRNLRGSLKGTGVLQALLQERKKEG